MRNCRKCHYVYPDTNRQSFCSCGGIINGLRVNLTGTRDSFGIGKDFQDKHFGTIDNFKSWERAGYGEPDFTGMGDDAHEMTERVKETRKQAKSKMPMGKRLYHETGRDAYHAKRKESKSNQIINSSK